MFVTVVPSLTLDSAKWSMMSGSSITERNNRTAALASRLPLAPGDTCELTVTVQRPGTVRGKLVQVRGSPLPGVRIVMRNLDVDTGQQTDGGWAVVQSDRQGRYAILGVPPGRHRIHAGGLEGERIAVSDVFAVEPGMTVVIDLEAEERARVS